MPMTHDFWLFREGERAYTEYKDLLPRRDAPVSIDDQVLRYCDDTLVWIPTFNPATSERGHGLNWWGPTIIDQTGGSLFHQICSSWAQLFTVGPAKLRVRRAFSWHWPFEESEHVVREDELNTMGGYTWLEVDRESFVEHLTTLAHFGEQAATGKFFILHLGI